MIKIFFTFEILIEKKIAYYKFILKIILGLTNKCGYN